MKIADKKIVDWAVKTLKDVDIHRCQGRRAVVFKGAKVVENNLYDRELTYYVYDKELYAYWVHMYDAQIEFYLNN